MARRGDDYDQIVTLLREHGATLARSNKHWVWKLPDGRIWTVPMSPSDCHSYRNNLSDLKSLLGVKHRGKAVVGERRPKRRSNHERQPFQDFSAAVGVGTRTMAGQLAAIREALPPRPVARQGLPSTIWIKRQQEAASVQRPQPLCTFKVSVIDDSSWLERGWRWLTSSN